MTPISENEAREFLERSRWGKAPYCPSCGSSRIARYKDGITLFCSSCRRQFSLTAGTIFEGTHLSPMQLIKAMHLFFQANGKCSSYELSGEIQTSEKTARRLIRLFTEAVSHPSFNERILTKRRRSEPKLRRSNGKIIVTAHKGYNSVVFANILKLYVPQGSTIADVTYGYGMFWAQVDRSKYNVLATDLSDGVDLRALPYADETVDCIVLDPPYMTFTKGTAYASRTNMAELYKVNIPHHPLLRGHTALLKLYHDGAREAHRVLKPKGILVLKTMDEVVGEKQRLTHVDIVNDLTADLYVVEDLFVVVRPQPPMLSHSSAQKHARKNHSYFLIFRKQSKKKRK